MVSDQSVEPLDNEDVVWVCLGGPKGTAAVVGWAVIIAEVFLTVLVKNVCEAVGEKDVAVVGPRIL